jgi:hypothetical protein
MHVRKHIQTIVGAASLAALGVVGLVIPAAAQDSSEVTLVISAGSLTMYAADATDNNDLCASGDSTAYDFIQDGDAGTSNVTCGDTERSAAFGGLNVASVRQTATVAGGLNDALFEDLSGVASGQYSVSLSVSDIVNDGAGADIQLGPTAASDGGSPLTCTVDPSAGSVAAIAPEATKTASDDSTPVAAWSLGASTVIDDIGTDSAAIFSSDAATVPGRYDTDGINYSCEIPAFVEQGSYTQTLTFTVSRS